MHPPGSRRVIRRETAPAGVDGGAEQRRLEATVARLRLELARLRGEVDEDDLPTASLADSAVGDAAAGGGVAEAEARAAAAEERVRQLVEELGSERRALKEVRTRLAALEEARGRADEDAAGDPTALERISAVEAALAEEREARLMLETLRDGLERAMEEQRRLHEREVTDVQEAAEDRRAEQSLEHLREVERVRGELAAARGECAALAGRMEEEEAARSRAEARVRELDREVDELRNWISAAESRRRGLFRRGMLPPPPGRISPGP